LLIYKLPKDVDEAKKYLSGEIYEHCFPISNIKPLEQVKRKNHRGYLITYESIETKVEAQDLFHKIYKSSILKDGKKYRYCPSIRNFSFLIEYHLRYHN
jgi:hypothetical protein